MKGIIVPGVTDMNKGDQALVWESHRLAMDTGCFTKVYIVSSGDTKEEREKLCSQSEEKGYEFVENILRHPRRGKHHDTAIVKESLSSFLTLAAHAVADFLNRSFLLLICNNQKMVALFYNKQVAKTIGQFKESDVIFVKGGGFIHAYGEKTAPYLMWFFLFYVRLALAMKKKVIFLPNSFGPFEGLTVKSQVKSVFKKLDRVYAREALSAQKLGELLNAEISVSPDLGFYLKMAGKDQSVSILNKYGLTQNDKIVGITIRPWRFPGKSNPEALYENYITAVAAFASHLLDKGYKVALCNQSIGPNSHEDDRNAIKELTNRISHPNLVWINENLPCDVLKALYSNFYAFVGTRFHSVIFSLTSLVPSLAIGYGGNKAKGIMSDFNLQEFTIQIEDSEAKQLISMFEKLVSDYDGIKKTLASNIEVFDQKRENLLKDIAAAIR
jgi:colanic acid/amylovoran biosynthesis protein